MTELATERLISVDSHVHFTDEWVKNGYAIDDWKFGDVRADRSEKPAFDSVQKLFASVPQPGRPSALAVGPNGDVWVGTDPAAGSNAGAPAQMDVTRRASAGWRTGRFLLIRSFPASVEPPRD